MKRKARVLPLAALTAVVAAAHLSLAPKVAGVDGFYHLGHAGRYLRRGLFDTSFPWATQSVIGDLGADLWWGFHMVLVPFMAVFSDVALALPVAALTLSLLACAGLYWVLVRHGLPGAGWWTALFFIAVPNVMYRLLMVRPHVLSLVLALLLLSFLVRGRARHVLVISAAIAWLHIGLFWMAPGVVAAYALARGLEHAAGLGMTGSDRQMSVPVPVALVAVLVGTALGVFLRPHPLASIELAWVQIVRLFAEKATHRPLVFAVELRPLPLLEFLRSSWTFLIAWAAALAAGAWFALRGRKAGQVTDDGRARSDAHVLPAPERTLFLATTLCAVVFLALTLVSARRALVEFVAFGFLAFPIAWRWMVPPPARRRVTLAALALLVVHLPWAARRHELNVTYVARPPDTLEDAALWLRANSSEGEVVFHAHWDNFGPLFARDDVNGFLGGMDPIFQYAHDPGRYWEHFFLAEDLIQDYTCDAFPCYEGTATDTYTAIRDHFNARWVLVEAVRNPKLTEHLLADERFVLAHETAHERIFRVLDPEAAPAGSEIVH